VEGPVHNSVVIVSLGSSKNALVMMCKFDKVDAVAFGVVGVYLLARFKIVQ
jgi:hypothetical protein